MRPFFLLAVTTPFLALIPCLAEVVDKTIGVVEVSPVEDLMREHGVLERLLLIYDELGKRLLENRCPLPILRGSVELMQAFIENYHERLEEEYIFPKCAAKPELKELVTTLKAQHDRGRQISTYILNHATEEEFKNPEIRKAIAKQLTESNGMFLPHAAREDTVLFPAFKTLLSPTDYDAYGDMFEAKENELFGKDGFESVVTRVARLEKELGLYNLSQYTAAVPTE